MEAVTMGTIGQLAAVPATLTYVAETEWVVTTYQKWKLGHERRETDRDPLHAAHFRVGDTWLNDVTPVGDLVLKVGGVVAEALAPGVVKRIGSTVGSSVVDSVVKKVHPPTLFALQAGARLVWLLESLAVWNAMCNQLQQTVRFSTCPPATLDELVADRPPAVGSHFVLHRYLSPTTAQQVRLLGWRVWTCLLSMCCLIWQSKEVLMRTLHLLEGLEDLRESLEMKTPTKKKAPNEEQVRKINIATRESYHNTYILYQGGQYAYTKISRRFPGIDPWGGLLKKWQQYT